MKHKKLSIKWKIFSYLLAFTAILLIVLWLLQICYLDTFYKMIKTGEAEGVTETAISILQSKTDTEAVSDEIDKLASEHNMAIMVTDLEGNICYDAEYIATSRLNTMPTEEIERCLAQAVENGGSTKIEFEGSVNKTFPNMNAPQMPDMLEMQDAPNMEDMQELPEEVQKAIEEHQMQLDEAMQNGSSLDGSLEYDDKKPQRDDLMHEQFMQNRGQDMVESVIYIHVVNIADENYILMVNTQLTPVDATVQTLRVELIWITAVMVVLSLIIALLISRQISKSFIKINDSAKEMAKGKLDVYFEGDDYREIAELSATLNATAAELYKNEKFRRELIANVSHDLRTPLTMIIAYAEVMRDLPGENSPENVQVVIDEAQRLTNLVNDMLDISKLQAGVMQMNASEYNLTESIESVFERYNKLKEQEGYNISFEYDKKVLIEADEYKIFQVIYNLVNNAINYTGDDKNVLVRQMIVNDKVRIEVIDSGEGIAPENVKYVWDRYYKVDKTHKRALMGTGLGLSIVKNILELHGAEYGVESVVGKGSTFWFELSYKEVLEDE